VGLAEAVNPLRLTGRALPPSLVLVARLLAALVLLRGEPPFRPYLPYLEFLDLLPPDVLGFVLRRAAEAGCLLAIFSPFVRIGAGLAGSAHLIGLLACRPCHSVAHTFVACVLLAVSLSSHATGARILRGQVVLLYAGAAIAKTLDPDWWNGRYFDALLIGRHQLEWYRELGSWFPDGWVSTAIGGATIVIQWVLAVCFLLPRMTAFAIALGVVFHATMAVMIGTTFGPFMGALAIVYLAFLPAPGYFWRRTTSV
jgi:hypothetical protein